MSTPTFSVVVPTYRRPQALANCLHSLEDQTFDRSRYEVVVVDDDGEQGMVDRLVKAFRAAPCRLLTQNHLGAGSARNAGAAAARGQLLAFTDDDCRPHRYWLSCLERKMEDLGSSALVGGRVINSLTDDPYATASQALVDFLYQRLNREPGRARLLTSNNLCMTAEAFRSLGGFDPKFPGAGGEDRDLCLRWSRRGWQLVYEPKAVVFHAHGMNLASFVCQNLAYGRGAALLRTRAASNGYHRVALESASFYKDLLRYPQVAPEVKRRWTLSALFLLSQVAVGVGYLHALVKARTSE